MSPSSSRRRFVKSSLSAGVLAATGPLILNAQDKAGSKKPRVGSGEYTYECEHDWGMSNLPSGHAYGNASHGVTIDKEGFIYITHQGSPGSIFVFDPSSQFVRSMGEIHRKGNAKGHGIDIREEDGEEFLYLAPSETSLAFTKMSLKGEVVWQKDRSALHKDSGVLGKGVRFRPTNTSFLPDGGYHLGDGYGSNFIFQFDKDDNFVRVIGGRGSGDGKFSTPHGQWLDQRDGTPKLVVCDRANKRLQWFDTSNGKHLRTQDGFLFPADIDIRGELMLVPDLHGRVTILDGKNQPVAQLGDDAKWRAKVTDRKLGLRGKRSQWQPGRFVHPHDACFDSDGNIFVVEWVSTGRVTKLVKVS